jgi:hypothetical protein
MLFYLFTYIFLVFLLCSGDKEQFFYSSACLIYLTPFFTVTQKKLRKMEGTYVKLVHSLAKSNTHQFGSHLAVIFDHGRKYD